MSDRSGDRASKFHAWSALGGAIVGSVIVAASSIFGPLALQARGDQREDHRDRVAARGAARLLFYEFLQASEQMAVLENDRILRRFDPSFRIEMRSEDMLRIASGLPGESWGDVQLALGNVEGLSTYVNTQIERGRRRLTKGETCFVRIDLVSIRSAAGALADLADAPGKDAGPAPKLCRPQPGPLTRAFRTRSGGG